MLLCFLASSTRPLTAVLALRLEIVNLRSIRFAVLSQVCGPAIILIFVHFQVNNGLRYFLDYVQEDLCVVVLLY